MITKCFILPYFGDYPPWMDSWYANTERMEGLGYNFLHDSSEDEFRDRVRDRLGIEPPVMHNTGRVWNFRPALGYLYQDLIAGYDFWGHTDFDVVYGRVERWYDDDYLDEYDIVSNDTHRISGPWTLYSNTTDVNELFMFADGWRDFMESDDYTHGWAEKEFTQAVERRHAEGFIRRDFKAFQTKDWGNFDTLKLLPSGRLMEGHVEVCLAHFRRTKEYPEGCVL